MKRILIICFSFLTILSCDNDNNQNNTGGNSLKKQISGKWEWIESKGGFLQVTNTPESTKSTKQLYFQKDKVIITNNLYDTIPNDGYHIQKEKSSLFHEYFDILTIDFYLYEKGTNTKINLPMRYIISRLDSDSLYLDEDVYDGFSHKYKRSY